MTCGTDSAFTRAESENYEPSFGLTKRELFAAMAMQGLLSTFGSASSQAKEHADTAQLATKYADALLAELAKEKP